jgi:hypothetical protein
VRRTLFDQIPRVLASCLLVFLQVNLLGVAMLHWHGEMPAPQHGQRVDNRATQSSPTSDGNLPCTVCQIVQSGAAQTGHVVQVLPSSNSVPLIRLTTPIIYHLEFLAMSYGRAPPIA